MTYREEYRQDRYRMQDGPRRGDIIGAFTDAVRDNPMSAALIGLGALWLFAGGNRMTLLGGNGRTSIISSAAHGAGSVAHGAGNVASRVGHSVSSGVSSIGETISDTASRATDYVSGSFRGVDAESAYRNPRAMSDDTDTYGDDGYGQQPSRMSSMRDSMQDMFERHPVALGVAGLALGAGVAASLPLTRMEREQLGKAGEAVRSKVSETATQAKEFAGAMLDEVKHSSGV